MSQNVGSPEGYVAETSSERSRIIPSGEQQHEHHSLYRIRRTQEKRELLYQAGRRDHRGGRESGGAARRFTAMGETVATAVGRGDGGNIVQRLDLRHTETIRDEVGDGAPADAGSDHGSQEEERRDRRQQAERSVASQSTAELLRGHTTDSRTAADAAVSQPSGLRGGADEESYQRAADGNGSGVQPTAAARKGLFRRTDEESGGSARVGAATVEVKPGGAGDVRGDTVGVVEGAANQCALGPAGRAAGEHTGCGRSDRADLGAGNRRSKPVSLDRPGAELLRADGGAEQFGRQAETGTAKQATQSTLADSADRSGQAGAALEFGIGGCARERTGVRQPQSSDAGSGSEAGGLSAGGGPLRPSVPDADGGHDRQCSARLEVNRNSELTSGKSCFPPYAARRNPDRRTVLAGKGSLRRAKIGRALAGCGPFC